MEKLNKYLNMLLVQQKIEILEIALNLKLFKLIEEDINRASTLSSKLLTKENNTKILLDSLVFMELLIVNNDKYENTALTKEFLIFGSYSYCGDVFLHRKEMLNHGKKMISSLLKKDELKTGNQKIWANAARFFLKQEQKNLISPMAVEIIKNLKEYNLEDRVSVLSGDIKEDDIGKNYDLIWCSNIFYFFKDKKEVIKKIYDALNPNGILVSCHVEIDTKNSLDENSFFYFLSLNFQGKNILKPMELSNIFEEVGFKSINSYTTYKTPMTPSQIHICKK